MGYLFTQNGVITNKWIEKSQPVVHVWDTKVEYDRECAPHWAPFVYLFLNWIFLYTLYTDA